MLKKVFGDLWFKAYRANEDNILELLEPNASARLLDVGCSDGEWTLKCSSRIGTTLVSGVEVVQEQIEKAKARNIDVRNADLNTQIPFEDGSFDVIHANQVIEHLYDTERFLQELNRTLTMDGYVVVSTENASSWHNIFALVMGWQMFSLTNVCSKGGIGNPIAIHRGDETMRWKSMEHVRIFSYLGLREYMEHFGFEIENVLCSGYYPLPHWVARIDPRHGHFITVKARKVRELPQITKRDPT